MRRKIEPQIFAIGLYYLEFDYEMNKKFNEQDIFPKSMLVKAFVLDRNVFDGMKKE